MLVSLSLTLMLAQLHPAEATEPAPPPPCHCHLHHAPAVGEGPAPTPTDPVDVSSPSPSSVGPTYTFGTAATSFIVPGAGQMLNGEFVSGLGFLALDAGLVAAWVGSGATVAVGYFAVRMATWGSRNNVVAAYAGLGMLAAPALVFFLAPALGLFGRATSAFLSSPLVPSE